MKRKFTWAGIVTALLLGISTLFVACNEDIPEFVNYNGKVVYAGTTKPFPALEAKVTNGSKIHCNGYTDEEGQFSLSVRISEIDGGYYLLIGNETCIPQKIQLSGFGQEEVNVGTIEIEGPTLPTVITSPISNISDNKAISGGKVTFGGRLNITARGVCWAKTKNPTINGDHTKDGTGEGEFTSQITGLEGGELYYVRAYATNEMGTAYGEELTLTTITGLPTVTTNNVTNITATTATCGGNVAAGSGYSITSRGVCWSRTTATPTTNDSHTSEIGSTGSFTSTIIGLERNTTYYVRAYAVNQKGISYGETKTFTTLLGLPTVKTTPITVSNSLLISGGNVTDDGGSPVTARGVCYGQYPHPDLSSTYKHTSDGTGTGYYTSTIGSFSGNIYVRAYATNANGTSYGQEYTANASYMLLPTFVFNGTTYKVAPDPSITMTLDNAKTYCKGLELYGYSDWYLPTKDELYQMFLLKNSIGGFTTTNYWSSSYDSYSYNIYYFVSFDTGHISWTMRQDENMGVRPIRKVK